MEFLVDTGMELARHIIFKAFDLAMDHATKSVAGRRRVQQNAQAVRDKLEPQLDKIEAQIKDLAEGMYRTALSHLWHALVILKEQYDTLNTPSDVRASGHNLLVGLRKDEVRLPESATNLIAQAYDKAINAFHSAANLSPSRRIQAMQVAILCIGLQHVQDNPKVILRRWEKCVHDVFADQALAKCIQVNVETTRFRSWFAGNDPADLQAFITFARDLLAQVARVAARDEADRTTIESAVNQIAHPAELDAELREKWAEKLDYKNYVSFIHWRDELKVKQAGAAFDACAALPDGGIVVALGNDALIQYNRDLEKVNFQSGSYYTLAYDPARHQIWGFSKKKQALVGISLESLQPTGEEIGAPVIPDEPRVSRWHLAISSSGKMVMAAQFMREKDVKNFSQIIYARGADSPSWHLVPLLKHQDLPRAVVTDISIVDSKTRDSNLTIALAMEGYFYLLEAQVSSGESKIAEVVHLLPDSLTDRMSCSFDEVKTEAGQSRHHLIVVVRRQTMNVIDPKRREILKKAFALRASGNWVATGQSAIWTPTLTGDICQYEYFIM